ncbi:hypothetical protein A8C32_13440 [Flavivirga aquatica]|uniref:Secretion system C-terminal sorting domain-containing protein n=1 Tax=Flavivirga aquatica TaxID=1849968 RepID=A0A1E5TEC3_9FLAO|nr:T9SS type A sorting domain-containing protein [Flavivirga aquatica]OEK09699.1 hypothetical protein A8C32_13440 [Flavivirga aquatica]
MKKITAFILGIFASSFAFSQTYYVGENNKSKFDLEGGTQIKNYLLGTKHTLIKSGELTSINLIGKETGSKVKMAIYKDNNNAPGDLVISTKSITVKNGINSISIDPKRLPEGNYWIMAVYNNTGNHTYTNLNVEGKKVYYSPLNFKNNLPSNGSGFKKSDRGSDIAYFLEIDGKTASISPKSDIDLELKIYPNPVSNHIFVTKKENSISTIEIKDLLGNTLKTVSNNKVNKVKVDLQTLQKGTYFLVVNGNEVRQIIKK